MIMFQISLFFYWMICTIALWATVYLNVKRHDNFQDKYTDIQAQRHGDTSIDISMQRTCSTDTEKHRKAVSDIHLNGQADGIESAKCTFPLSEPSLQKKTNMTRRHTDRQTDITDRQTDIIHIHRDKQIGLENRYTDRQTDKKECLEIAIRGRNGISTVVRKQFHVLAVALFLPGLVVDPETLFMAASCAVIVLVMLEVST